MILVSYPIVTRYHCDGLLIFCGTLHFSVFLGRYGSLGTVGLLLYVGSLIGSGFLVGGGTLLGNGLLLFYGTLVGGGLFCISGSHTLPGFLADFWHAREHQGFCSIMAR